jgi:hypothetical protein
MTSPTRSSRTDDNVPVVPILPPARHQHDEDAVSEDGGGTGGGGGGGDGAEKGPWENESGSRSASGGGGSIESSTSPSTSTSNGTANGTGSKRKVDSSVDEMDSREARQVFWSKVLVMLVLLASAACVGALVYLYVAQEEEDDFELQVRSSGRGRAVSNVRHFGTVANKTSLFLPSIILVIFSPLLSPRVHLKVLH